MAAPKAHGRPRNHLELAWQVADFRDLYTRLAGFARLIIFDRRGTGMSDGVPNTAIPTWEDFSEDAGAVLDAAGSARAATGPPPPDPTCRFGENDAREGSAAPLSAQGARG
jgi:hypothetical protein